MFLSDLNYKKLVQFRNSKVKCLIKYLSMKTKVPSPATNSNIIHVVIKTVKFAAITNNIIYMYINLLHRKCTFDVGRITEHEYMRTVSRKFWKTAYFDMF